jgi:hypothetical protein
MTSSVIFACNLPTEWREVLKSYEVKIAGYWKDTNVCNILFGHVGEDYYDWINREGRIYFEPKLQAFLDDCLDYIDEDSDWEDGIDIYAVIKNTADRHMTVLGEKQDRDIWLSDLVQNAMIASK